MNEYGVHAQFPAPVNCVRIDVNADRIGPESQEVSDAASIVDDATMKKSAYDRVQKEVTIEKTDMATCP